MHFRQPSGGAQQLEPLGALDLKLLLCNEPIIAEQEQVSSAL